MGLREEQYRSAKSSYLGVELLHRKHVPEQRLRECEELILLDVDHRDVACPREIERVLIQAVQVALLDVAGGTYTVGGCGACAEASWSGGECRAKLAC